MFLFGIIIETEFTVRNKEKEISVTEKMTNKHDGILKKKSLRKLNLQFLDKCWKSFVLRFKRQQF